MHPFAGGQAMTVAALTTPAPPVPGPRLLQRWWAILVVLHLMCALAIAAVMLLEHHRGDAHYQEVLERLAGTGRQTTLADLLALLPAPDPVSQQAWATWEQRFSASPPEPLPWSNQAWDDWVCGDASGPSTGLDAMLARSVAQIAPAREALAGGALQLSILGWAQRAPPPGQDGILPLLAVHGPDRMALFYVALWLRYRAVLAADPTDALADFERLERALANPACLAEAGLAREVAQLRDRCYGDLALLGRLPAAAGARWLAEPVRMVAQAADACRGERIIRLGGAVELMRVSLIRFLDRADAREPWLETLRSWTYGPDDAAGMAEFAGQLEARLRGEGEQTVPLTAEVNRLHRHLLDEHDLVQCALDAAKYDAGRRLARLAVRILGLAARGISLPASQDELQARLGDAHLLAGGVEQLDLSYEYLGPDRFRLDIDHASSLADLAAVGDRSNYGHGRGWPPALRALVWPSYPAPLEIRLPAAWTHP
jgi:hypothetical protein